MRILVGAGFRFANALFVGAGLQTRPRWKAGDSQCAAAEQLGLTLETRRGTADVIVIDRVLETPTAN